MTHCTAQPLRCTVLHCTALTNASPWSHGAGLPCLCVQCEVVQDGRSGRCDGSRRAQQRAHRQELFYVVELQNAGPRATTDRATYRAASTCVQRRECMKRAAAGYARERLHELLRISAALRVRPQDWAVVSGEPRPAAGRVARMSAHTRSAAPPFSSSARRRLLARNYKAAAPADAQLERPTPPAVGAGRAVGCVVCEIGSKQCQ